MVEEVQKNVVATYKYDGITFLSYSDAWDAENLESLCEELLKNTHGREIDYLDEVIIYAQDDEDALGMHESDIEELDIPISIDYILPEQYSFSMPSNISILSLYNGDEYTCPEQMAITLSHEYGHHFTFYYFTLEGDTEAIENDPYFKARYVEGLDIRYSDESRDDWDEYLDNHMWYLIEIAAEDYVYLMGSPTTRREIEYCDTQQILSLDVRGKDDQVDEYYEMIAGNSFNQSPHENIVLELPDQVEGLASIYYGAIGLEAPEYADRTDKADDIKIAVQKRKEQGKTYYKISWNKPWVSEDTTYTLVAYDENNEMLGAIKSIEGDDNSVALIGSALAWKGDYYYWYDSDYWTEHEFLRFRVIVTFRDGTAAVSPAVDWSFS